MRRRVSSDDDPKTEVSHLVVALMRVEKKGRGSRRIGYATFRWTRRDTYGGSRDLISSGDNDCDGGTKTTTLWRKVGHLP